MNAIVAEDFEELRVFLANQLREFGFVTVLEASDGKEALELIESSKKSFDLLLTDYNMPKMTGLQLVEAVKQKNLPVKRIVIVSGMPSNEKLLGSLLTKYPDVKFVHKTISPRGIINEILDL